MPSIKVDLDTATREELTAEVVRLYQQCETWASSWQGIIRANAKAWSDRVREAESERDQLRAILLDGS